MSSETDAAYMARALQVARNALYTADPNPAVGCVLVKHGRIIAEGWTQPPGQAHAEIHALRQTELAAGATAYVTLEPCSHHGRTGPCCDALIAAGVTRVVAAIEDPNPLVSGQGLRKLKAAGVDIDTGVMAAEAAALNRGFLKRMTQGLPWITGKLAASLDGRTALASGESRWITSEAARADVHRHRAASSAVLTGVGTVLQDDPRLDARVDFPAAQPIKVVLDSQLRTPPNAKLLENGGQVWLLTCSADFEKIRELKAYGFKIHTIESIDGKPDLNAACRFLAGLGVNNLWVEAGAELNGAFLRSGLVDEWLIYMAPCILGDRGRGMFQLPELNTMHDKIVLSLIDCQPLGPDLKLIYTQQPNNR